MEAINDIELKEKIGSGCSGVVLKAHWKSKNIDVAVKKIHIKSQEAILKEVGPLYFEIKCLMFCFRLQS